MNCVDICELHSGHRCISASIQQFPQFGFGGILSAVGFSAPNQQTIFTTRSTIRTMDLREWLHEYWLLLYFGLDALLFGVSILLYKPDTRPLAGFVFTVALILLLAFLGALFSSE